MQTKEIDIEWEGNPAKVKIKRFTWGEKNDIQEASTSTQVVNGKTVIDANARELRELSMMKGIIEAPFGKTREEIRNLPMEVGELVYMEIDDFNSFDITKKGDSNKQ